MAFDEELADRVRDALLPRMVSERKMFGGLCLMLNGNMLAGILGDGLMARVGPDAYAEALQEPHTREMDFTGRTMTGFVVVEAPGLASDEALERWVGRCVAFVERLPPK